MGTKQSKGFDSSYEESKPLYEESKPLKEKCLFPNVKDYLKNNNITKEYINDLITQSKTYHFHDGSIILIIKPFSMEHVWINTTLKQENFHKIYFLSIPDMTITQFFEKGSTGLYIICNKDEIEIMKMIEYAINILKSNKI